MTGVHLSAAAAKALLSKTAGKVVAARTPKPAGGTGRRRTPYHTRCTCGAEFTVRAREDEHVAPGHCRFEVVL